MIHRGNGGGPWSEPKADVLSPVPGKNIRTPRVASVAARVRFHDNSGASDVASRLSTWVIGSGFSVKRSSLRCIFAMSPVRKQMLASPSPRSASNSTNPVCGGTVRPCGRHQLQRHVVEREQHPHGAIATVAPRRRARKQASDRRQRRGLDIADQNHDVIEPGDHGKRPARGLGGADLLHADRHRGGAMGNPVGLGARFTIWPKARSRM